jgi:hypothetical protein
VHRLVLEHRVDREASSQHRVVVADHVLLEQCLPDDLVRPILWAWISPRDGQRKGTRPTADSSSGSIPRSKRIS